MRMSQQRLRESNGLGTAKAKEEESQEKGRAGNVKCLRARGRGEFGNLGSFLSSQREKCEGLFGNNQRRMGDRAIEEENSDYAASEFKIYRQEVQRVGIGGTVSALGGYICFKG